MLNEIKKFVTFNIETEKTINSTKKLVAVVSLILIFYSSVMSVINIINGYWIMFASTILLTIVFTICYLICHIKYHHKLVKHLLSITIICLFTFYVVIGGNAGFAIDWILLVPVAYMTMYGLLDGVLMGSYFLTLLIICLWSPVNDLLPYVYSDEIRMRFPILYACGFFLAIVIGIRSKRLMIAQMQNEEELTDAVLSERNRVEQISLDAISSICRALDAKDNYTKEHSDHVAAYSSMIAQSLGWNKGRIQMLKRSAKVHDLGKIGIPDMILKKDGPLSKEEFAVMKGHVALGTAIVSDFTLMPELAVGAKYHHERYDGKGYSTGAAGTEIPIEGRIIALADAIDAMSSDRIYRKKHSKEILVKELKKGAGKQFDPELVKVVLDLIEKGMIEQVNGAICSQMNSAEAKVINE